MSDDKHHSDQLQRYLAGQMSDKERHDFERKALDDPFLQDALEGAEMLSADNFADDVHRLDKRITAKKSGFTFWQIAAVIALLLVSGISIWLIRDTTEPAQLAQKDTLEVEESTATAPDSVPLEEGIREHAKQSDEPSEPEALKPVAAATTTQPEEVMTPDVDAFSSNDLAKAEPLKSSAVAEAEMTRAEKDAWDDKAAETQAAGTAPVRQKAKTITESAKKESPVARSTALPSRTVTGLVMDDFGEPLPGVNVVIKGTTTGATTNLDGQFQLDVNESQSLVFSSVGMQSQEVVVGARSVIEVYLTPDSRALQEVVVTGYGAYDNEKEGFIEAKPTMGHTEFKKYLEEELFYPEQAISNGIQGRVVLQLTISPTGNVTNIEVKRSLGYGCDEEAVRLINQGPRWSPATRDGVNVETKVRVRVKFELN